MATLREMVADLVDGVELSEEKISLLDNISAEINAADSREGNSRSWKDEAESWKNKYDSLYKDYSKRFMETFREPATDARRFDVANTDTTFTESDITRFDFSGKNV